jgi:hypothetical protein
MIRTATELLTITLFCATLALWAGILSHVH